MLALCIGGIGGNMKSWGMRSDSLSGYTALDASHNF